MPAFSAAQNATTSGGAGVKDIEVFAATIMAFQTARAKVLEVG